MLYSPPSMNNIYAKKTFVCLRILLKNSDFKFRVFNKGQFINDMTVGGGKGGVSPNENN